MRIPIFILAMSVFVTGCASSWPMQERVLREKDDFIVEFEVYAPEEKHKIKSTVIILPPTGGINLIDRSYAKAFARVGATALVLKKHSGEGDKRIDLDLHQRVHAAALKAFAMILKTIPKDHEVGVLGTSLGGLYAAIAVNRHEEIDRVVVIGTGAPIPKIIANSTNSGMTYLREQRFKKFKFSSKEEYAAEISKRFFLDPLSSGKAYQKKKLGMVVLLEDEAVPTKYQRELQAAWQPDLLIERENSHFWGIIRSWLGDFYQVRDFLLGR